MSQRVARAARRQSTDTAAPHHEAARPARAPVSLLALRRPALQTKLEVNQPDDPFEREAEAVAAAVVQSPTPAPPPDEERGSITGVQRQAAPEEDVQRQTPSQEEAVQRQAVPEEEIQRQAQPDEETLQRQAVPPEETVQRNGQHQPSVSPATAATIRSPGPGRPLAPNTRQRIEPHLGANLSGVRVHTGPSASRAAGNLQARAFTYRNHIFLNRAESNRDTRLLAHEATHVVQQGAAVQRQPQVGLTPPQLQRIPALIANELADYARHIPGYTLFTVIIGFNPLTGSRVERTAMNLVEGVMGLVPFGTAIFDKLQELEILQQAFRFIDEQLTRFDLSLDRLERLLEEAYEEMDFLRLDPFDYNLAILTRRFNALLNDVRQFAGSLVNAVVQLIKDAALGFAEDLLAENRAWALIKKILKHDPLRNEPVEATTVEIIEDFLLLIGKEQELEQMRQRGTLEETAAWLDTQLGTFLSLLGELRGLIATTWDAIQPENLPDLLTNLRSLAVQAGGFLQRVWDFGTTVAAEVLALIKHALLSWLSGFAHEVPGFHLITVLLGRNPFTGEPVPRTAENIIKGFITLLPGGNQKYEELKQTGTIEQAAQRIEGAMESLGISWEFIVGLFTGIWESLSIQDLIDPIGAFQRIVDQFGEPIARLFAFIRVVIREIMMLVLELMNFPTDLVASIIGNAMQAFEDIKRDPVQFFLNLLGAVKEGFSKFFDNILQHLLSGLTNWLFGQLRDAGIQPPTEITLASILDLVLQILGISLDRIWQKLAERIGQENVDRIRGAIDRLSGIWNFVRDVQERGVAAIWEYIQSQISNLWDMVLEQARNWIVTRIIERVVTRLLSMLDPTGIMAVINGFMAFFNAVQSAIQYLREMLEIVNSFVTTVAEIARGSIARAAQFLENTLAQSLPVAIGFLANQVGLGNLGEKIQEIIAGIRGLIDRALDWLLDRAVSLGQAVLRTLGLGGRTEDEAAGEETGDVRDLVRRRLRQQLTAGHNLDEVRGILRTVFGEFRDQGLTRLELGQQSENGSYAIVAEASPPVDLMTVIPRVAEAAGTSVRTYVRLTLAGETPAFETEERQLQVEPSDEEVLAYIRENFGTTSDPAQFRQWQIQAHTALNRTQTVAVPTGAGVEVSAGSRTSGSRRQRGAQIPERQYWPVPRAEEAARARREFGGAVFQDAAATNTIEAEFWSLGTLTTGRRGDNSTHAEVQFMTWYERRLDESVRRRVTQIHLQIDPFSPCWTCSGDLVGFLNRARGSSEHSITGILTWRTPYLRRPNSPVDRSGGETTASSLSDLSRGGWQVTPSSLPESEAGVQEGYVVSTNRRS